VEKKKAYVCQFVLLQLSMLICPFLQASRATALAVVKSWCTESYTKWSTQRTHGTDLYGDNTTSVIPSSEGTGEDWKGSAAFGISPWNVQQAGGVLCTAHHPLPCPCWLLHKGKAALCVHFLLDIYSCGKRQLVRTKHRLHAKIEILHMTL